MKPLGPGDPLRLGPYRLIGVLGAGGMGQVYLGRDRTGRTAAVKVLLPEFAHRQEMARRFVREAQAARAVRGKGVARVLTAQDGNSTDASSGGRSWIATEFLAGPALEGAVARYGPLGDADVRALGAAVARTLVDIHATGLVHRDIKPSNIVLTSAGPRVIDFGIARPEHGLTLTATGQAPVTPGYGAPEQVLGQRVGPPGDVFSLGCVLAYAATGRRAYDGGHVAAVQYEVVHGEPRLDGVHPALRAVIAPCFAKDPAHRPLPEQLARALAPPRRAVPAWRTGPLADDIAVRETEAERLAAFPTDDTVAPRPGRRRALSLLAVGATAAVAALGAGAWWLLDGDGGGQAEDWAAEPLPDPGSGYRTPPRPLWGPVSRAAAADSPAPLPVRDVVVVGAVGGGLRAYGVTDGRRRWDVPGATAAARYLAPSHDLFLAADTRGTLLALDPAEDGKQRWSAAADVAMLLAADAEAVYVVTRQGRLRAVELASRRPRWTVPAPVRTSLKAPALAAVGGRRLVVCGSDGTVAALDTRTGQAAWPARKGQSTKALAPAVAGDTVCLGGRSLTALALSDGAVKWSHRSDTPGDQSDGQGGDQGSGGWTAPAVSGDALYAADGSELRQLRLADGDQSWTYPLPYEAPPSDPPVVEGHGVWIALDRSGGAGLATVRTRDGVGVWQHSAGQAGTLTAAGAGNRVFLLRGGALTAMPVF
ncbi:serine/threonine-protein kinase [Streptomyces sp. NPDC059679]|uniref:serine/threonine-protein kinase n=1 Tax=Streptomyces sp. NPDC059679 TaxID=3346903 RepID=UPI0036A75391